MRPQKSWFQVDCVQKLHNDTPESISSNEITQKIVVNQVCENVEICSVDLHDLNSQINYSDK